MIISSYFILFSGSTRAATLSCILPWEARNHPSFWWTVGASISVRVCDRTWTLLSSQRKPTINELQSSPRNTKSNYTIRIIWVDFSLKTLWSIQIMDFDACLLANSCQVDLYFTGIVRLKVRSGTKADKGIQETCKFSVYEIFLCKK